MTNEEHYRLALIAIRDSTYKSALQLRSEAERALDGDPTPPKVEPAAYLVTGGNTFKDKLFSSRINAEESVEWRKDGATVVELVRRDAQQLAPTPSDDVIRDAVSCALRELEVQFVEMSQAASRDSEPTRCDVWANAASQTRARANDKEWIDAAIREQQRSED